MVIELTISIISLIAGYITSQLLERHSEKYTRKSERFDKLYDSFSFSHSLTAFDIRPRPKAFHPTWNQICPPDDSSMQDTGRTTYQGQALSELLYAGR